MVTIKAIILNAGSNNEIKGLNSDKPKCLIDIEGNSLLEIQLNTLHLCGIDDIAVVRGYKAGMINIPGLKYYDNPHYATSNVLYSLFCAREEMDEDLLIIYGDILFEEQTIKRILESKEDIAVGVMVNWQNSTSQRGAVDFRDLEMLHFNGENKIVDIGKGLESSDDSEGVFIGIMKCTRKGAEILKRNYDRALSLYSGKPYFNADTFENAWVTSLLNEMAYYGIPLYCVIIERGWLEINTEEDYKRALTDTQFVRRLVKVKTDWRARAQTYDNIQWVNRDDTLDLMLEFAGDATGKKVLDLGTGTGKVLKAFKKRYRAAEYYGVDASPDMMEKIDASYGFRLEVRKIEDLYGFSDNSFDIMTARMVYHHSEDLDRAMEEVRRVLKPGGRFIICEGNPPDRYSIPFYEQMFRFKEDRHTFLADDIVNIMLRHGFGCINTRTVLLEGMSLNNWLSNAGVPFRNIDIIRKMHYDADTFVKKAYNMKITEEDIIMDWKFCVILGVKSDNK